MENKIIELFSIVNPQDTIEALQLSQSFKDILHIKNISQITPN